MIDHDFLALNWDQGHYSALPISTVTVLHAHAHGHAHAHTRTHTYTNFDCDHLWKGLFLDDIVCFALKCQQTDDMPSPYLHGI